MIIISPYYREWPIHKKVQWPRKNVHSPCTAKHLVTSKSFKRNSPKTLLGFSQTLQFGALVHVFFVKSIKIKLQLMIIHLDIIQSSLERVKLKKKKSIAPPISVNTNRLIVKSPIPHHVSEAYWHCVWGLWLWMSVHLSCLHRHTLSSLSHTVSPTPHLCWW